MNPVFSGYPRLAGMTLVLLGSGVWHLQATEFRAGLGNSSWEHAPHQTSCELKHPIPLYGNAAFSRDDRGRLSLLLTPHSKVKTFGDMPRVYWQAPEWKKPLSKSVAIDAEIKVNSKGVMTLQGEAARQALQGLIAGNYASVTYRPANGQETTASLSPVFFTEAHVQYVECIKELPAPKLTLKEAGFEPVYFQTDSHSLDEHSQAMLDRLAKYAHETPMITGLVVSGHADSSGSEKHNDKLSGLRSNAVAEYLLNQGFPQEKLIVESHGEFSPTSSNKTSGGRALNRRVELDFVYGELPVRKPPADPASTTNGPADESKNEAGTATPI